MTPQTAPSCAAGRCDCPGFAPPPKRPICTSCGHGVSFHDLHPAACNSYGCRGCTGWTRLPADHCRWCHHPQAQHRDITRSQQPAGIPGITVREDNP